jgi:hypothetical protein
VEDWELFFQEKSRRRSARERQQRLKQGIAILVGAALVVVAVVGAIMSLSFFD